MSEISKILVTVTELREAQPAVAFASSLAQRLGAALHVLCVWPLPPYLHADTFVFRSGERRQTVAELARAEMAKLQTALAELRADEERIELLEFGNPLEVTVNLVLAGQYDLVVVQSLPARNRVARTVGIEGTLAAALTQYCPCPVLALPHKGQGAASRPCRQTSDTETVSL